jgi:hypothetical protein
MNDADILNDDDRRRLAVQFSAFGMPAPSDRLDRADIGRRIHRLYEEVEFIDAARSGQCEDEIEPGSTDYYLSLTIEHAEQADVALEAGDLAAAEMLYWRAQSAIQSAFILWSVHGNVKRQIDRHRGGDTLAAAKIARGERIVRIAQTLLADGKARRGLAQRIQTNWKQYGWRRADGKAPAERTINEHLKASGI